MGEFSEIADDLELWKSGLFFFDLFLLILLQDGDYVFVLVRIVMELIFFSDEPGSEPVWNGFILVGPCPETSIRLGATDSELTSHYVGLLEFLPFK